jgi:hypothetical protein
VSECKRVYSSNISKVTKDFEILSTQETTGVTGRIADIYRVIKY